MIASAIFFSNFSQGPVAVTRPAQNPPSAPPPTKFENVEATRATGRHLYGNPDAGTTIVEFSDFECPFCANLHPTLKKLVDDSNGTINWEYRHLPLPNHQNARPAAIASECVAREAGGEAFWDFTEILFNNIGKATNDFLQNEALKLGVSASAYLACIKDPAVADQIDEDSAIAAKYGGSGTPYSLIVDNATKKAQAVSGALPIATWQTLLANRN